MPNSGRTLICSVLFLDIVEYSKRPVEEQIHLKHTFNRLLRNALRRVAPRERIILDTGDGAAVTFPGDPEDALFTAIAVRDSAAALPVRFGINLGPVRLVRDINRQTSIIGDGINVAERVMSFSSPGQLLVSRSFYEVVSRLSRDFEHLFRHVGSRTDKHIREHELYAVVSDSPEARGLIDAAIHAKALNRQPRWMSTTGPLGLRHSALLAAPLAFALAVAGTLGLRAAQTPAPVAAVKPVATEMTAGAQQPAAATLAPAPRTVTPKPAARKPASRAAAGPGESTSAGAPVKTASLSPSRDPALIQLAVTPWGEVFVDGRSRGVSPPLRSVEVASGIHVVEIRNGSFPAHVERIEVRAGDQVRIRHRFR